MSEWILVASVLKRTLTEEEASCLFENAENIRNLYRDYLTKEPVIPLASYFPSVIPLPKGGELDSGKITTTASYQTVASHKVTSQKQLQLSKIVVSTEKASWIKYLWGNKPIGCERLMDDKAILIEHFPWDYQKDMVGDGVKAFDVQAKWYTEAGIVNCEIVGEEI